MFDNSEIPRWLSSLLTEKFFNACIIHEDSKKNEKNVFCLDCCEGICPHCFILHPSHRLLQIRRYVYHDVIRLGDADKLMDCAQVQSYTTNSAKVVFLNQRPQTRPSRPSGNYCMNCDRNLQESYLFCSLSCKLKHVVRTGCRVSNYLRNYEFLALSEPGLDDGEMTPVSVLEPVRSVRAESGSSSGGAAGLNECPAISSTETTEVVRKKRSNLPGIRSAYRPACRPVSEFFHSEGIMNRRKGTPHRSPLY
ncbi:hypothetical protein CDL12_06448 [Handroanthus impetiginosus]|uniref:B box-type domain-containing protein n=1 Tax=Handroanthus impetiginosus TaxID=429701 RepID=A0A2G9HTM2_9LAMI|nr:hypothetical protein CDL12_06448 [Handroanthus impetiginosus]